MLLALVGCAAPPPPLALPGVAPRVAYEPGGGGGAAATLQVELLALALEPEGPGVDTAAVGITAEQGAPFRGAAPLPPGSRWLVGDHAANWVAARGALTPDVIQSLGAGSGVLAPGLTTVVQVDALPVLRLLPHDDGFRVRLRFAGDARGDVWLPWPQPPATVLLFVPAARAGDVGRALLLQCAAGAPADAVAAARAAAEPGPRAPEPPAPWRLALRAVGAHNRRPALLALAQPLALPQVVDLLLVADEPALAAITTELTAVAPDAPDLPWQFERAAWTALLDRIDRDELPPAMQSCLRRHLGAMATDTMTLRLCLTTAGDGAALAAAVLDENLAALAERDAARALQAHEWLLAAGKAVPGFAPLAPLAQRQALLRQHAAAEAAR